MAERVIKPIHNVFKQYRKVNLVNPYWYSKPFESTWRTSNTSTGSSASNQIKLPLQSTGSYNFTVDWGDGTRNIITVWNQAEVTHTYAVAGDYTINITGNCIGWSFANTGDRLKILSVLKWGKLRLGNNSNYFQGCSNLNLSSVDDVLDLTGTTSLLNMFYGCSSLSTINRVSEWNVSFVSSMDGMFFNCKLFNQSLNNWITSSLQNISRMFSSDTVSVGGMIFNQPLNNWITSNVVSMNLTFGSTSSASPSSFNQPLNSWDVSNVTDFSNTFRNCTNFNQPLNNWITSSANNMAGMFRQTGAFNQNISNFITTGVTSTDSMFLSATAFNNGLASGVVGNMLWNTSNIINMTSMFNGATAFNQNIGSWSVSNVTNFTSMFEGAVSFNNGGSSDINNWILKNTSSINMSSMFRNATNFNQPLNLWNTSLVTTMNLMFGRTVTGTNLFNQNIGSWNVSNVGDFSAMFGTVNTVGANTSFNNGGSSDINNWVLKTTSSIIMSNMFRNARAFNQPIGNWNTTQVTSVSGMFASNGVGTNLFNQNIGSWNVSNVSSFSGMFYANGGATSFNNGGSSDINNWVLKNTGSITMDSMFNASPFNQPIGNWNTSQVTNSNAMFKGSPFNQNIGSWNVSSITDMREMFQNANNFNQNIGSWNVSNVTNFTNFMAGKTSGNFSASNLDAIYSDTTGWASRPVKPNIVITFNTIKYTAAGSAGKAILQGSPNNWTITDGGI